MGDENPLLYLLGGGGLAVILSSFIKGLWDYIKGRHDRERASAKDRRDTISELKDDLREAEEKAKDSHKEMIRQRTRAGLYWEYASLLRQHAIRQHDAKPSDLPPWPDEPGTTI